MATTATPHTESKVDNGSKDVSWDNQDLVNLTPSTRELLETYSGIPASSVEDHVRKIVGLPF
jgi:hypothetical protein